MSALDEQWRKAKVSNNNGACVEVRLADAQVQVRDTKALGQGPILGFTPAEWTAFVEGVQAGEFDL